MSTILTIGGGPALTIQQGASMLMKAGGTNYDELILASNPVGYWKLDETSGTSYADSSVNSTTGTIVGSDFRQGSDSLVTSQNNSLFLNNISEVDRATTFVELLNDVAGGHPFTTVGNNNSYTLEAWIQCEVPEALAGAFAWRPNMVIIELRKTGASPDVPFSFGIEEGTLALGRAKTGSGQRQRDATNIADGAIHHVVAVVTVDDVDWYIDGAFSSTDTFTVGTGNVSVGGSSADMQIGIRVKDNGDTEDCGYAGFVQGVAVYGTALSAGTILAHYNAGTGQTDIAARNDYAAEVLSDSPLGYYRLSEPFTNSTASDLGSNALDGTYQRSLATRQGQSGIIFDGDAALRCNGGASGVYVELLDSVAGGHPYTAFGDSDFSLECWIIPDSGSGGSGGSWWGGRTFFELREEAGSNGVVCFNFGYQTTNELILGMASNHTTTFEKVTSSSGVITALARNHVVVTCAVTGSLPNLTRSVNFYVNGVSAGSGSFSTVVDTVAVGSNTANMQIAYRATNAGAIQNNPMDGWMDEVAIYGSVLSPARVLAHYNAGIA